MMLHYHFMIPEEFGEKKFARSALSMQAADSALMKSYLTAPVLHKSAGFGAGLPIIVPE